jgi:ATP-dependent RNA helicase DDX18/HAS1
MCVDRQTLLFSATQTTKVNDLVRVSFLKPPLYINVDQNKPAATNDTLEQVMLAVYITYDSKSYF